MPSIHSIQTDQGFLESTISVRGRDARAWFKSKFLLGDKIGDALLPVALPAAILQSLGRAAVFFDPLYGNHGDHLLTLSAQRLINNAGLSLVEHPDLN